ncbi:hypothetical protein [Spiroplasma eriocheiris]|uniref:Transmembrane protein n=1 Tax=Spiroplasma eriocheiris TaxID=315358 RepID=A0A0H3XHX6_9MOLU|nr:hypothetical protein [Spiroplasma eriocheiris]AHF57971.1 hypothetical protein SPE_0851 [Spiroplasma eriocheiris CCTCC M 207170]AKM54413.1 hypothetical protein SERIO_v1c08530 [Spiroplasma eriocheiris]
MKPQKTFITYNSVLQAGLWWNFIFVIASFLVFLFFGILLLINFNNHFGPTVQIITTGIVLVILAILCLLLLIFPSLMVGIATPLPQWLKILTGIIALLWLVFPGVMILTGKVNPDSSNYNKQQKNFKKARTWMIATTPIITVVTVSLGLTWCLPMIENLKLKIISQDYVSDTFGMLTFLLINPIAWCIILANN